MTYLLYSCQVLTWSTDHFLTNILLDYPIPSNLPIYWFPGKPANFPGSFPVSWFPNQEGSHTTSQETGLQRPLKMILLSMSCKIGQGPNPVDQRSMSCATAIR